MADSPDRCAFCGAYIDTMNGEAVAAFRRDHTEVTWCSVEHQAAWFRARRLEDEANQPPETEETKHRRREALDDLARLSEGLPLL